MREAICSGKDGMDMLKLPRLIGEGCVLQRGKKVRIYGTDAPGSTVTVRFQGQSLSAVSGAEGKWEVFLKEPEAGGPFRLEVENEKGESRSLSEVYVGEVWVCSGQSNMELPMQRVADRYPEEMAHPDGAVRMFLIGENYEFDEPLQEHMSGEWKAASPDSIPAFSASAYFFGKELHERLQVPVGLILAAKGGSRIEAWMSRKALADHPELLKEAKALKGAAAARFVHGQESAIQQWLEKLEEKEAEGEACESGTLTVPGWLSDAGLEDFCGSVLLSRRFLLPEGWEKEGESAILRLGTLVDSDRVYLNGVLVGETGYQYPPRKYAVPGGVLKAGENEILIRLVVNDGRGRITPGKEYSVSWGNGKADLAGEWEYRVAGRCTRAPEMDFLCRKASGLYQGMLAPCLPYTVRGIFWYQGESNDRRPEDYGSLLKGLIRSWREGWGEELPFIVAQLPAFSIDLKDTDEGWPRIRQAQLEAAALPGVAVTVNLDLGEKNDLHPLDKAGIGHRAALAAEGMVYGEKVPWRGPRLQKWERGERGLTLFFEVEGGGALRTLDGEEPGEFWAVGPDGVPGPVPARLCADCVVLEENGAKAFEEILYAWSNAPCRGLLCDENGLLTSPFRISVRAEEKGKKG